MDKIKSELSLAESQLSTFRAKKTQSSATRSRAHLLQLKKLCDVLRREILAEAKALKAAKPAKVEQQPVPEPTPTPEPVSETVPETVPEPVPEPAPEPKRKPRKPRATKKAKK